MESFRIDGKSVHAYQIDVVEVGEDAASADLVRTLIDIDLQTFAESTYSEYTAQALLRMGRVFLLMADGITIGTCVCFRSWERPGEVMLLSMGIRPGWRGKGLGQQFVRGVMERLRARGIRSVALLVGKNNRRALKVYTDVGFRVVGEHEVEPDPFAARGTETQLLMRAQLRDEEDAEVLPLG